MDMPPSTVSVTLVTNEFSSLVGNSMARATSVLGSGSRGLRGFAADRFRWSLLPVGHRGVLRAAKSRG